MLPSIKTAINYANKGSHALQAHCLTEVYRKKVQVIASTHSVAMGVKLWGKVGLITRAPMG